MCFQRSSKRIEGNPGCCSPGGRSFHTRGLAQMPHGQPQMLNHTVKSCLLTAHCCHMD